MPARHRSMNLLVGLIVFTIITVLNAGAAWYGFRLTRGAAEASAYISAELPKARSALDHARGELEESEQRLVRGVRNGTIDAPLDVVVGQHAPEGVWAPEYDGAVSQIEVYQSAVNRQTAKILAIEEANRQSRALDQSIGTYTTPAITTAALLWGGTAAWLITAVVRRRLTRPGVMTNAHR